MTLIILGFASLCFGLDLSMEDMSGGSEERVTFRKIDEGESFSFKVVRDEDVVVDPIRVWNAPEGSQFDGSVFSWTPNGDQSGMYNVSFSTTEPITGNQVFTSIRIVVADTYFHIRYNKLYERLFTATDPDDDKVTITVTGLPAGATFTGSQFSPKLFAWRPTRQQIGNHQMIVTAADYPEPGEEIKYDRSVIYIKVTKLDVAEAAWDFNDDDQINGIDFGAFTNNWMKGVSVDDTIAYAKMAPEEITMEQLVEMAAEWLNNTCIE